MLLLGIETAAELVGVAVAGEDGPRAGVWVRGGRRHAESLAPAIAHVLDQIGATLPDVDVLAVDIGPGLFTGLRVGVATAQGIAQALGVGVVGVDSCAVLAAAAYGGGWTGPVAAVVDARRGEVFWARYEGPGDESRPPGRAGPAELADQLSGTAGLLAVGGGAVRYADLLAEAGVPIATAITDPDPRVLAEVALRRLAAGAVPVSPSQLLPLYLREADAKINWVSR